MPILFDTSFIYALIRESDKNHKRAQEILKNTDWKRKSPICIPTLVINETYTLVIYRSNGNLEVLRTLDEFFWGDEKFYLLINLRVPEYRKITKLIQKYVSSKKNLSFVDVALIYLGKNRNINEIVSFDKHFDGLLNRIC